ncbi:MAG TPA: helix-turn-helix domain-containing protein, partial [Spirochaetia bacterium]|nr:helix-turn-helix domain-containing protein [Spirochaetia bacterium]
EGKFRKDLYYRLNVVPIFVPPLRDHLEDIEELVRHFAGRVCRRERLDEPTISEEFIRRLRARDWSGNVRELENLIERILILYRPVNLGEDYLEAELAASGSVSEASPRQRIVEALRLCGGNKTEAAAILAMPRRTLYYKIEQYRIEKADYLSV